MEVAFGTARVEIGAQSFPRSHLWWIFPSVVNILLPAGLATAPWFALAPQGPMPMDGTFQGSTGLPDIRRIELGNYHRYPMRQWVTRFTRYLIFGLVPAAKCLAVPRPATFERNHHV